jgi:GMP synthase (glutamine-hydrolysing)
MIRKLNVHTIILPLNTPLSVILNGDFEGIIISGGPDSVFEENAPKCDPKLFETNIPILGICYGMQLMNMIYGGEVTSEPIREDGQIKIQVETDCKLFEGLGQEESVLLTHGDSIQAVPECLRVIAKSQHAISGISHNDKKQFGVQFHPEVDLTINGQTIFNNFLFDICDCDKSFNLNNRLQFQIKSIQKEVGDRKVIVLASGGVDSTVCAALLFKALDKDQVYVIHIDNGFMRQNESDNVKLALEKTFPGHHIKVLNCRDEFLNSTTVINKMESHKLCDTCNPEEKRKIIGDTFMKIITKEIKKLELNNFLLCQGTLRPDLIESASNLASSNAQTIKTHHNDTNLVRQKRKEGLIIEPLKDYHKDEVRELGLMLGLDKNMVYRHPFPGPGLAIRIL